MEDRLPPQETIGACLQVLADLQRTTGELLRLAGLEAQIAARSLLRGIAMLAMASLLVLCAAALLEAALVAALLTAGLPVWAALGVAALANVVVAMLLSRQGRQLFVALRFHATRRQLRQLLQNPSEHTAPTS